MRLTTSRALPFLTLALTASLVPLAAQSADEAAVQAAFDGFYQAINDADEAKTMSFVAPDAVFLESGFLETRAEYEEFHLPADIEFESEVDGERMRFDITIEGNVAWVVAETEYIGEFQGADVAFISMQLMVLSKTGNDWKIRSVHWSSMRL